MSGAKPVPPDRAPARHPRLLPAPQRGGPVMSGSVDWTTDATWTAIHHPDHTEGPLS